MGYITTFHLYVRDPRTLERLDPVPTPVYTAIKNTLSNTVGCPFSWDHDGYVGEIKWYSSHADLAAASKNLPSVVLELTVVGEDADDQWTLYAYRGKSQVEKRPKWAPPPPSRNRLDITEPFIPFTPPDPHAQLRDALKSATHDPQCLTQYTDLRGQACDCWVSTAKVALEALEKEAKP